jgi:hypothetical protein
MATIGVSITKTTAWRGGQQAFSNVYHYLDSVLDANRYEQLVTEIVLKEKVIHSSIVNFVGARVWEASGTPAENETLLIKDLTGTGSATSDMQMYRELAYLISWELERRDNRGRKKYLRKWIHAESGFTTSTDPAHFDGYTPLPISARDPLKVYADAVDAITILGASFELCSPKGEKPMAANNGKVYDVLEHRQFGR